MIDSALEGPTVNDSHRPLAARLLIASIRVAGAGSLILFAVFLFLGPVGPLDLRLSGVRLLAWDAALCMAFCLQHSVMVRPGFRRRSERLVPPHLHGAVYTVASAALLCALVLLWQESPVVVLKLQGPARWIARGIFAAAILGFWWGSGAIPHFDPFGVGPIKDRLRGREPRSWPFTVRGPYRWVRHPQYLFVLLLVWSHPDLTADRLLFNGIITAWIVLGTVWEERDLVEQFGADYLDYQRRVPMLLPYRRPWSP